MVARPADNVDTLGAKEGEDVVEYFVYLAGPVTGHSYKEAMAWRDTFKNDLPENILTLSPLSWLEPIQRSIGAPERGIFVKCFSDVTRAHIVVANLIDARKVSIGTVMEIAWAWQLRKPLVVIMDQNNIHDHAFIREVATFVVPTIMDAQRAVETILGVV